MNDQDQVKLVPLGLMPAKLWVELRVTSIKEAMARYIAADKPIPQEWLDEYLMRTNSSAWRG